MGATNGEEVWRTGMGVKEETGGRGRGTNGEEIMGKSSCVAIREGLGLRIERRYGRLRWGNGGSVGTE